MQNLTKYSYYLNFTRRIFVNFSLIYVVSYQPNVKLGGFHSGLEHPMCHDILKSSETTKQSMGYNIYIYIYGEMGSFRESDKMIKISGKGHKTNSYNRFSSNISFSFQGRTSSD